jgi:hypothetical protein
MSNHRGGQTLQDKKQKEYQKSDHNGFPKRTLK